MEVAELKGVGLRPQGQLDGPVTEHVEVGRLAGVGEIIRRPDAEARGAHVTVKDHPRLPPHRAKVPWLESRRRDRTREGEEEVKYFFPRTFLRPRVRH